MSSRNALNPIWEETFELDIHLPDLAFIRFNVVDVTSNLTTAQRVVPVNRLRYNINFKNYSKSILKQYKIQICPQLPINSQYLITEKCELEKLFLVWKLTLFSARLELKSIWHLYLCNVWHRWNFLSMNDSKLTQEFVIINERNCLELGILCSPYVMIQGPHHLKLYYFRPSFFHLIIRLLMSKISPMRINAFWSKPQKMNNDCHFPL